MFFCTKPINNQKLRRSSTTSRRGKRAARRPVMNMLKNPVCNKKIPVLVPASRKKITRLNATALISIPTWLRFSVYKVTQLKFSQIVNYFRVFFSQ